MIYTLRKIGDAVLKQPTTDVEPGDDTRLLVAGMRHILTAQKGLGLSAQQVGSTKRIALCKFDEITTTVCINLRITSRSDETGISVAEGCLSAQNDRGAYFRTNVRRHKYVTITYEDEQRQEHERSLTGLAAVIAQHEADHLDGRCITDGVSRQQRKAAYRMLERDGQR